MAMLYDGGGAVPPPVPLGGGGIHWFGPGGSGVYPGPVTDQPGPGIHWFGPGGAGVAYPSPGGGFIHLPEHPFGGINAGGPMRGIPQPGYHPAIAHMAARRAAVRALSLRRRLF